MDNFINNGNAFKFLEIEIVDKCNNEILFMVSQMNVIDTASISIKRNHQIYNYKNNIVIYTLNQSKKENRTRDFFNPYFQKLNDKIETFPKGVQSMIIATGFLYKEGRIYGDSLTITNYMNKDCDDKE
ncbi:hypothetical protein [Apibacter sp. HY039]|uniref:hypothetical protein n=1 Tax=Apibacter sp. HY039 TaxID=2501476 RepID=UPI000FEC005F|nr:hypothetical protein [Apibacter sp. HY039]